MIRKDKKDQKGLPKGAQSKNADVLIVFYQLLQLLICQLASLHDGASAVGQFADLPPGGTVA